MPSEPTDSFAERVERLFHEATDIEAGARDAWLKAVCEGEERLLFAVQELIDAYARVGRKAAWSEPAIRIEARRVAADGMGDATL